MYVRTVINEKIINEPMSIPDCVDGSDEYFTFQEICNGVLSTSRFPTDNETNETGCNDCPDGRDEFSCNHTASIITYNLTQCRSDERYCARFNQTNMSINDCPLEDDEHLCSWTDNLNPCCSRAEFPCKNRCIPRNWQCNNKIDCLPGGEDEWLCDLAHTPVLHTTNYPDNTTYPAGITSDIDEGRPPTAPSLLSSDSVHKVDPSE
ncbi:unnamed protein product, partial [Didymodactylos carnosus]